MSRNLESRLTALSDAVELAEGRLDEERVAGARGVVERAGRRLGLGLETTVVALAGPTGAGKSSLFNALAGAELVRAGRIRPTTSSPTAAVWGDGAGPLLDWLEVPIRHDVGSQRPGSLVLLDLPDFDSVERGHRDEVDRMVELVDLMVWVVDPQKYADSSLHDAYLKPLSEYRDSMVVVLNQADLLPGASLESARRDLQRVLADDGLDGVPVLAASARSGAGLEQLHGLLDERVRRRESALARLATDVSRAAAALSESCQGRSPGKVERGDAGRLVGALEAAAGVPTVVRAVGSAHRRRGSLAAGWPFTRWLRRLRPDPLRRLRVGDRPQADVRTSLPAATAVQRSQVSSAIRTLAASTTTELPEPWPGLARSAAAAREEELADRLDRALAGAELPSRTPLWWRAASLLQLLLALAVGAGALWLLGYGLLGYLQVADLVPIPEVEGLPLPTLMLAGGVLAGIVLAVLARIVNGYGARRRQRRAQRELRARVQAVAEELVIDPLQAELGAYERLCARLREAGGARAR